MKLPFLRLGWRWTLAALGLSLLAALPWLLALRGPEPIRVGVLHSLSGSMASSETPVMRATLLAIEELNARGGVLGREVEPVVVDGRSDWPAFAREAERLLSQERVSALFGCWTSSCRKSVKPVVERHASLLFYPLQYEGLESSPAIIYTGSAPNQQILPAVDWCVEQYGRRAFLNGSDYVFPRVAHALIRQQLAMHHAEVVGEDYLPLGSPDVEEVIRRVVAARPDFILNTLNGDTNAAFFRGLRAAGITPEHLPTLSFSVAEAQLPAVGVEWMVGHYAAWNYFQSLPTKTNRAFVERFQHRYGRDQRVDDPMEAAYVGVHLWAQAAEAAGTEEPRAVRTALRARALLAPSGLAYVDPALLHLWKTPRIGRIRPDGQFDIVWSARKPLPPVPFPVSRSREEWEQLVHEQQQHSPAEPTAARGAP